MRNGEVSYWWQAQGGLRTRRASLPGPTEADVCIVGGGYTGLWTAYYLAGLRPGLRIVVLEAAFAGYGASGRNGGWVTAELPGSRARYARAAGGAAEVRALEDALRSTVDEVGRVCAAESISCDFVKGGRLSVATTPSQLARLRAGLAALPMAEQGRLLRNRRQCEQPQPIMGVACERGSGGYDKHCLGCE